MPGTGVRAVKRTTWTWGNPMPVGAGPETTVVTNIPVAQFRELVVMVRHHSSTWGGSSGATVTISVRPSAPTDEDPAQTFRPSGAALWSTSFGTSQLLATLVLSPPLTGFGTHVDVTITFTQGGTLNVQHTNSLSVDFSLKS